jgi:hypothetical protein
MEDLGPMTQCPNCDFHRLKEWSELSDAEKLLANSQPASADFTLAERKKHRFCTRCWFEEVQTGATA